MKFIEIEHIDAIEKGDHLLVQQKPGGTYRNLTVGFFRVKRIKETDQGKEIILQLKGNIWFNINRYLNGTSWVQHVVKVQP